MGWTPGPWTIYPDLDDCYPFAIGTDETTHPSVTRRYIHAGVEREADARLISLAPELYEALYQTTIALAQVNTPSSKNVCELNSDLLRRARGEDA